MNNMNAKTLAAALRIIVVMWMLTIATASAIALGSPAAIYSALGISIVWALYAVLA